jgi:hypothetical protein
MLFALLANPDQTGWLSTKVLAPGHFAAALFLRKGAQSIDSTWQFTAEFALDLVVIWIVLLIVVTLLEKSFGKSTPSRREHA